MVTIDALLDRAADPDATAPERAAALTAAARIATPDIGTWPAPPAGWAWQDDVLVRVGPSVVPPLRVRPVRVDAGFFRTQRVAAVRQEGQAPARATKRSPKAGTKAATVLAMIGRPQGAGIDELTAATGMSPVSLRATVSVYARDRASFNPTTRTYRLVAA